MAAAWYLVSFGDLQVDASRDFLDQSDRNVDLYSLLRVRDRVLAFLDPGPPDAVPIRCGPDPMWSRSDVVPIRRGPSSGSMWSRSPDGGPGS